jgi:hypothetical protein
LPEWFGAIAFLDPLWRGAKAFAESNLITALFAALAGAWFGARAAQRSAGRAKLQDELLKEVRNTNAAAMLMYGIAGRHLGLKKQHVWDMHSRFFDERKQLELFFAAREAGRVPPQQKFEFNADYATFKPMHAPVEQIDRLVFGQASLSGAVLLTTQTLLATIQSLNECIEDRSRIIDKWEALKLAGKPISPYAYFGLREGDVVDQRYMHSVQGICTQTDDVIAFSIMIGDQLYDHALRVREALRDEFGVQGPTINKLDFTDMKEFLPPDENYKDFWAMFSVKADAPLRVYERFKSTKPVSPSSAVAGATP